MRTLTTGMVLCLLIAGCGSGASKPSTTTTTTHSAPVASTATAAAPSYHLATSFNGGYEQAWGEMKQVGAEIAGAIRQVKQARAKHQAVSDGQIASEFAIFASRVEPAVIELQGLTPPASVAGAYRSMASAAVGMSGALRNFSSDANANRAAAGVQDLASYFRFAVTIDKAAATIYHKLGIK